MKTYKVALTRTYIISVQAEDEDKAKLFSEYYLGDLPDLSSNKEQIENKFSIKHIDLVYNQAHIII